MKFDNIRFNCVGPLISGLVQKVHSLPDVVLQNTDRADTYNLVATACGYTDCQIAPIDSEAKIRLTDVMIPDTASDAVRRDGTISFTYCSTKYTIHEHLGPSGSSPRSLLCP